MIEDFEPTGQQAEAMQLIDEWLVRKDRPYFYLAGDAGTGKSTMALHAVKRRGRRVGFCAPTGKAANVMERKGMRGARTVASMIYTPYEKDNDDEVEALQDKLRDEADPRKRKKLEDQISKLILKAKQKKEVGFSLNSESDLSALELLILDEGSMVGEREGQDLLSFGVPILVMGDPFQLPPVKSTGYFTSRSPDYYLTEVVRQAMLNPLLKAANRVRHKGTLPQSSEENEHGYFRIKRWKDVKDTLLSEADQIIVGKNQTRWNIISHCRKLKGKSGPPTEGDRLICLRNNHFKNPDRRIMNGEIGLLMSEPQLVDRIEGAAVYGVQLQMEDGRIAEYRTFFDNILDREWVPPLFSRNEIDTFDFADAITTHKAQGSEWDRCLVIDDGMLVGNKDRPRWVYTNLTRARIGVTWVTR